MANINELKKYEIEALVQEELYKEEKEVESKISTSNNFLEEARTIIRKMINEEDNTLNSAYDPDKGLDDRMKQTKALVNLIIGLIYRFQDIDRDKDNLDNDIVTLLISTQNAAIKSSVTKLFSLWNNDIEINSRDENKEEEISADPTKGDVKVEIGENIISPQNTTYIVEKIEGDKVCLLNDGKRSRVDINIANKWKKKK